VSKNCQRKQADDKNLIASAKSLGHVPDYFSGGGHPNGYICSCGWKSRQYWDLAEAAWDEWRNHVNEVLTKKIK